jgi:hypothetical protein
MQCGAGYGKGSSPQSGGGDGSAGGDLSELDGTMAIRRPGTGLPPSMKPYLMSRTLQSLAGCR